jgi:hypothetical protein
MMDLYSESETDIDDLSYYWNGYYDKRGIS